MAKEKKKQKANINKRTRTAIQTTLVSLAYDLPVQHAWLDDEEIAKIDNDATVLSAVSIRKSTTLKKELLLDAGEESISQELTRLFDYTFRTQTLDTVLQGFSVFELNWYLHDGYYYPKPVERDYRAFSLGKEGLYYHLDPVNPLKAIYCTHRAKFNAPLGRPLYSTLFWLRRFKAASLEFWVEFLERFGKPWVIGKTDGSKDDMADELYSMLGGDVAVVENEDEIDLKTPTEKGAFREIVTYLDDQIREAIVGGNLTGNVTGGSFAAAKVHKEVSDDIAMTDGWILHEAIAAVIERFKELNAYHAPITFQLKDKDDPQTQLAERDAHLAKAFGDKYQFSKSYLEETYKITLEDRTKEASTQEGTAPHPAKNTPFAFTAAPPLPTDEIARQAEAADTQTIATQIAARLEDIFAQASSYEDAFEQLRLAFSSLDEMQLFEAFQTHLAQAMLYGAAQAADEEIRQQDADAQDKETP